MSERDIHTIPWNELTDEEQEALRALDRQQFPDLFAKADEVASDIEASAGEL